MWGLLRWVSEGFYLVVVEFTNKQKLDQSLSNLENFQWQCMGCFALNV